MSTTTRVRYFFSRSPLLVTLLLTLGAPGTLQAMRHWVALNSAAPPGSPARIVHDSTSSTAGDSFFDVWIEGYWEETVLGDDGRTYQRIEVPGLGHFGQVGAPDLPVLRFRLAVASGNAQVRLASVVVRDLRTIPNMLVWPQPVAGNDEPLDPTRNPGPGDPNGTPDVFTRNELIYSGGLVFPAGDGPSPIAAETLLGSIPGAKCEVYPAHWDPTTNELSIAAHVRYHYSHPGAPQTFMPITDDRFELAKHTFTNWPTAGSWIGIDPQYYWGRYLIVTPEEYLPTLEGFIEYRKACGLQVTIKTTQDTQSICGNIRGAIDDWYQLGPAWMDHYCLLVGDTAEIPFCLSPNAAQVTTDDLYGSPSGSGDLDEEIYVGRLSVDDATDLAHQVDKIIGYETDDTPNRPFDEVLLVAHKEDAPGKYEGAHEDVANAFYTVPPIFHKVYGSDLNSNNSDIEQLIEASLGLVAYRGHGSTSAWTSWNLYGQEWHSNDVIGLNNPALHPVVWAFNCTNQNLDWNSGNDQDSIGEVWLEANHGGVAHYGSTETSGTDQNHVLDKKMFEAVYDRGLTTHSHAIAWAENEMAEAEIGYNSWMYLLLGDPFMKVRRSKPAGLDLIAPSEIPTCTGPSCNLTIQVQDGQGQPLVGAVVSGYMPAANPSRTHPDFAFSVYSNSSGMVVIPGGPTSLGVVQLTVRDREGNVLRDTIRVRDGQWTDLGDAKAGVNGKPRLFGSGSLLPFAPTSLELTKAASNSTALLFTSLQNVPVPILGGILHPNPGALLTALPTDSDGKVTIQTNWPALIPSGTELYFQYAIVDLAADQFVSFSNALKASTP